MQLNDNTRASLRGALDMLRGEYKKISNGTRRNEDLRLSISQVTAACCVAIDSLLNDESESA